MLYLSRFIIILTIKIVLIVWVNACCSLSHAETVKIMGSRTISAPEKDYFIALTMLVLSKTEHSYPDSSIKIVNIKKLTQGRLFRLIDDESIDIVWSGTNKRREKLYLPIRIPLMKGMLGYRVLLANKDNREKLESISSESELKALTACQGMHWPDSDILEGNGFLVHRVAHHEAMFEMVEKKRCDYFPRAIFEGAGDSEEFRHKYPNIVQIKHILLQYPLPVYYFVNKKNKSLAKRLYDGLFMAIQDGSLLALMKSHENTKSIFPINKWKNTKIFKLSNLTLPLKTPLNDKKLWVVLGESL